MAFDGAGDKAKFRTASEPVGGVRVYRFTQRDIIVPTALEEKMIRYAQLNERTEEAKKKKQKPPDEIISEKQALGNELKSFLHRRFTELPKSVLKKSHEDARKPSDFGKDSHVYFKGTVEEFLAKPDTPRYVTKYSVPDRVVMSENIEYLKKKYRMLKKLMGKHIPRTWFVLGEFRHGIPKHMLGSIHTTFRAITIQREIRGKTFSQMTPEERASPEVVRALKEAMRAYETARDTLKRACIEAGVKPKTLELSLDIGDSTPEELEKRFDAAQYQSPNVMYDVRKKRVFFIDMGWGEWSPEKEQVYQKILRQ